METTFVFYVPVRPKMPATLTQYKEYRIPSSRLPRSYLKKHLHLPNATPYHSGPSIILDDTTAAHFDLYEAWLKDGKIYTMSELGDRTHTSLAMSLGHSIGLFKKPEPKLSPEEARATYGNLLGCYALATTLHERYFQDAIASKIVSILRSPHGQQSQFVRLLSREGVQAIIGRHGASSPLFFLVVSAYARFATAHEIGKLAFSNYPGEFKSHVMKEMALLRARQHVDGAPAADFAVGECRFHGHGFYEPCSVRRG